MNETKMNLVELFRSEDTPEARALISYYDHVISEESLGGHVIILRSLMRDILEARSIEPLRAMDTPEARALMHYYDDHAGKWPGHTEVVQAVLDRILTEQQASAVSARKQGEVCFVVGAGREVREGKAHWPDTLVLEVPRSNAGGLLVALAHYLEDEQDDAFSWSCCGRLEEG